MKTNAVIRIVLWSIVTAVLVGILLWFTDLFPGRETEPATTQPLAAEITEPVIRAGTGPFPIDPDDRHYALETMNVRSAPTLSAEAVGVLEEGTEITLTRLENVQGRQWGYITAPEQGWVVMEFIQTVSPLPDPLEEAPANGAPVIDGPGTGYGRDDLSDLREINIEWALGNIYIQSADVARLEVKEVNQNDDKVDAMVVNAMDKEKLVIRYSDKSSWNLGLNITDSMAKDLYITVPQGFTLESLEVDAASATLTVRDMVIQEVDFDGASGTCDFINCDVDELDLDTASGDITFSGSLNELDCDAASASVRAVFTNVPRTIDMDSVSGDLDITLPKNASFTATLDAVSSEFVSDFGYSQRGKNTYYRGSGGCKINMDGVSGDVYVRKYTDTPVEETLAPAEPTNPSTAPLPCPIHGADCDDPSHHSTTPTLCPEHGADCDDPTHHR